MMGRRTPNVNGPAIRLEAIRQRIERRRVAPDAPKRPHAQRQPQAPRRNPADNEAEDDRVGGGAPGHRDGVQFGSSGHQIVARCCGEGACLDHRRRQRRPRLTERQQQAGAEQRSPVSQGGARALDPKRTRQHRTGEDQERGLHAAGNQVTQPQRGRHVFFPFPSMRVMSRKSSADS